MKVSEVVTDADESRQMVKIVLKRVDELLGDDLAVAFLEFECTCKGGAPQELNLAEVVRIYNFIDRPDTCLRPIRTKVLVCDEKGGNHAFHSVGGRYKFEEVLSVSCGEDIERSMNFDQIDSLFAALEKMM